MSIRIYSEIQTPTIYEPSTLIDAGLAAGQASLVATAFSICSGSTGAIIGVALRLAYKINEWALNGIFEHISKHIWKGIELSLLRKVVEVLAAAALVSVTFSLLISSTSLTFSNFLVFSVLEDLRPIRSGVSTMSGNVVVKGLSASVSCRLSLVL